MVVESFRDPFARLTAISARHMVEAPRGRRTRKVCVSGPKRSFAVLMAAASLLLMSFVWLLGAEEERHATQGDVEAAVEESPADLVPTPAASALRSRWVSQRVPQVIGLGKTGTATFVFRNIGSTSWIRSSPAEARLGVVGDDTRLFDLGMAVGWPAPNRLAVQAEDVVAVGDVATFTFRLRGSVTGIHHILVRPVVDGVTWMDDDGAYFDFVVSASAP